MANIVSTKASYDRRKQEWEYQRDLAERDIAIAAMGIDIAQDRVNIVNQESTIAETRLEFANDTVEFLGNKFLNKELYQWMSKNLRKLYLEQLNMAVSTAKGAQKALEFERQTSVDFIGYDYWDDEKKGLLGAERLLKDINKMDQFRLSTATRRKEIEKTISLASVAPAEFQKFRQTGVLEFETANAWFDRDFPGHYMRLIRDVSMTVMALVPPNEGIRATLSNPGISRVMVGEPFEQQSIVYRLPESVAISSPYKATGLFELKAEDPMLLPLEGSGVSTTWRFEMPRGANRLDYNTIADVLFTVRYTALEDRSYRQKVLASMGQDEDGFVKTSAVRHFSLRNDFADQWYHLANPVKGRSEYWHPASNEPANGRPQTPYTMFLDLKPSNFAPNEDRRWVKKITFVMQLADGYQLKDSLPVAVCYNDATGQANLTQDRIAGAVESFNGKSPYGRWILGVGVGRSCDSAKATDPGAELPKQLKEGVRDLWLVVEYGAAVHFNRN